MSKYVWEGSVWLKDSDGAPVVMMYGREVDNPTFVRRIGIKGFKPYFWRKDEDTPTHLSCFGDGISKVEVFTPDEVPRVRRQYEKTFEADIPFDMRFVIDKGIYYGFDDHMKPVEVPSLPPRICYFDIEVSSPKEIMPSIEDPKWPIVMIQVLDSYTDQITVFTLNGEVVDPCQQNFTSEVSLLKAFFDHVSEYDYDIVTGWYCIPKDMYVETVEGLCQIQHLHNGYQLSDTNKVVNHVCTGKKSILNIKTSLGWGFRTSEDHFFLVKEIPVDVSYVRRSCDTYPSVWKRARELTPDDILICSFGTYTRPRDSTNLSCDDCYLAGLVYGDGTVHDTWTYKVYNNNGNILSNVRTKVYGPHRGVYWTLVKRTEAIHDLIYDVDNKKSLNIELLSRLSLEQFCAFVAGWVDADGWIDSHGQVSIGDTRVSDSIGVLFKAYGILVSIRHATLYTESVLGTIRLLQMMPICERYLREYSIKIGQSNSPARYPKVKAATHRDHFRYCYSQDLCTLYVRVDELEHYPEEECFDIETTTHSFSIGCEVHNSEGFDIPYVMRRARRLKVSTQPLSRSPSLIATENRFPGRTKIDLLVYYKDWSKPVGQLPTYDLKYVYKHECGVTYVDYGDRIDELILANDWKTLVAYGKNDVVALRDIDRKTGLVMFYENLRRLVGIKFEDTLARGKIIEYFLMHKGIKPLPTREHRENVSDYKGALVLKPTFGVKEWVGVCDLKALYPSIIVAFDVSPDIDKMIPKVIVELMEARERMREQRLRGEGGEALATSEQSLKYIINAFYGYLAFTGARLYKPELAAFITKTGRDISVQLHEKIRSLGYQVVYGDTDSTFISVVKTGEEGKKIEIDLNNLLQVWAREHGVKSTLAPTLKLEKIYKTLMFKKHSGSEDAAKKRYVGWLVWKDGHTKDEISYTGIEVKRSDTSLLTKRMMEEFFRLVLKEGDTNRAIRIVKDNMQKVKEGRVSVHDVAVPKGVHKTERQSPHVRGMKYGQELLGIKFREDKKPKLLYCTRPVDVVCIDDDVADEEVRRVVDVDWARMALVCVEMKMKSLVESLGLSWEEMLLGQTGLRKWLE